ncbi:hypothetical protein [Mycolicibacterium sp. CBMA 234]|uniref:hypothetical protein n=1 Tax=Mycolicibacterium sp. CBMA 234 TaxID=1918495 RepID=UPI0012DEE761|nr:hypothetical protein [Mycolicibacterium sp. CBMA 234]
MAHDSSDGQRPIARADSTHTDPDGNNGRTFGQLPDLMVPDDFDEALPPAESAAWESDQVNPVEGEPLTVAQTGTESLMTDRAATSATERDDALGNDECAGA